MWALNVILWMNERNKLQTLTMGVDLAPKSYSRYTEAITTGIESIKQQENGTLMANPAKT